MLLGALYGDRATHRRLQAQFADGHAARPSPACVSYLPHLQLNAAHHPGAGPPECYTSPRYAQFDANAQDWVSGLRVTGPLPVR